MIDKEDNPTMTTDDYCFAEVFKEMNEDGDFKITKKEFIDSYKSFKRPSTMLTLTIGGDISHHRYVNTRLPK